MKIHRIALYHPANSDPDPISGFNPTQFSAFKYGSGRHALAYGTMLAERFWAQMADWTQRPVVLTCSAFLSVPNAAHTLMSSFQAALNEQLCLRARPVLSYIQLFRPALFEGDYGRLTLAERNRVMAENVLHINQAYLREKRVVVVDDIRITGLHEDKITVLLRHAGVREVCYLYIACARTHAPELEHELNHAAVSSLDDVRTVMQQPDFVLNSRVCKFILSQPVSSALDDFFQTLPESRLSALYAAFLRDGYGNMGVYQPVFGRISQLMYQRGLAYSAQLMQITQGVG